MTEAQAVELVWERFNAVWPGATGNLPFAFENEALPASSSFAHVSIKHSVSQQITHGPTASRRFVRRGWIFVKLWGPQNAGRAAVTALADIVRTIFEGQSLSSPPNEPVTIEGGLTQEVGIDGAFYMSVVRFPFRYYATV